MPKIVLKVIVMSPDLDFMMWFYSVFSLLTMFSFVFYRFINVFGACMRRHSEDQYNGANDPRTFE